MATRVKLLHTAISPTLAGASFTGDVNFEGGQLQYDASSNSLDFQDNIYAQFGTGNDAAIYYDGSHFRLRAVSGNFNVQTNDFHITDASNQSVRFVVDHDGETRLYHLSLIHISEPTRPY